MSEKILIDKICDGWVIDHIESGKGESVLRLLRLLLEGDSKEQSEWSFLVGLGLRSPKRDVYAEDGSLKKRGRKDLIKVSGPACFDPDYLFFIDPYLTVKKIQEYEVVRNHTLQPPTQVHKILGCGNPTCITNQERNVETNFLREGNISYRCHFCGRIFGISELVLDNF